MLIEFLLLRWFVLSELLTHWIQQYVDNCQLTVTAAFDCTVKQGEASSKRFVEVGLMCDKQVAQRDSITSQHSGMKCCMG